LISAHQTPWDSVPNQIQQGPNQPPSNYYERIEVQIHLNLIIFRIRLRCRVDEHRVGRRVSKGFDQRCDQLRVVSNRDLPASQST